MQYAGAAVSLVALTLSVFSLLERRRLDKRDLLLKLHEILISPELQAGRRLLFNLDRPVSELSEAEYASANRALATLDVAGYYCAKKYVRENDFLELWDTALSKLQVKAAPFLDHRDAERADGTQVWSHYRQLAARATSRVNAN
ncbi:hypothetical protein [Streptomyces sp. NPDC058371]|jgi:hypothetical protein|uniref:hypothetical protein n=1 Tax=Streptomyces sp. NPDC058371 TaxID=3346463 RepID=UPI00365A0370